MLTVAPVSTSPVALYNPAHENDLRCREDSDACVGCLNPALSPVLKQVPAGRRSVAEGSGSAPSPPTGNQQHFVKGSPTSVTAQPNVAEVVV